MRSSRKIIIAAACAVAFFVLIWLMDMALYPCTYLRNDIHSISTGQADVIILGTSCAKMGIDPDVLLEGTDMNGHNLAAGSEYPVDSYYLTKLAVEKQDPKMIIYEVDPGYFTTEKEKGNNYVLFQHEFPLSAAKLEFSAAILHDSDIRALLFPFYEYPLKTTVPRIGNTFARKVRRDYSIDHLKNDTQIYHENGFIERTPVKEDKFPKYEPEPFSRDAVLEDNIMYLEKLINLCDEKGIEFIAVSMPLPDHSIEAGGEGLAEAFDYFSEFFALHGKLFYNFNREQYKSYSHQATHYVDYSGHLNGDSAREFSGIFGEMLKHRDQKRAEAE